MKYFLWIAILFMPGTVQAHEVPIHPVNVGLQVYPTEIRMLIDSNHCYWSAEVLRVPSLPYPWRDGFNPVIKKYVDDHFKLAVDGVPLESRFLKGRYVQEPWQNPLEGRLLLQFTYALPSKPGLKLEGSSTFFSEHALKDTDETYVTYLDIPGRVHKKYILPLQSPRFELALSEATRAPWHTPVDAFMGLLNQMTTDLVFFGVLALGIALFVRFRNRQPGPE